MGKIICIQAHVHGRPVVVRGPMAREPIPGVTKEIFKKNERNCQCHPTFSWYWVLLKYCFLNEMKFLRAYFLNIKSFFWLDFPICHIIGWLILAFHYNKKLISGLSKELTVFRINNINVEEPVLGELWRCVPHMLLWKRPITIFCLYMFYFYTQES